MLRALVDYYDDDYDYESEGYSYTPTPSGASYMYDSGREEASILAEALQRNEEEAKRKNLLDEHAFAIESVVMALEDVGMASVSDWDILQVLLENEMDISATYNHFLGDSGQSASSTIQEDPPISTASAVAGPRVVVMSPTAASSSVTLTESRTDASDREKQKQKENGTEKKEEKNDKNDAVVPEDVDELMKGLSLPASKKSVSMSSRNAPKQRSKTAKQQFDGEISHELQSDAHRALSVVVIGHVDHGKSTLTGHLLYKLDVVSKNVIRSNEANCGKIGKSSFHFAWVLDENAEERERGITMDIAIKSFHTEHRYITMLDAPGHRDYTPNMIYGCAQADVAILVVSAAAGEFESGFELQGQTREHATVAKCLGVKHIVVAINKLDTCQWKQERFEQVVSEMEAFLRSVGFSKASLEYVPCAGLTGVNIKDCEEPLLQSWWKGPTLLGALDKCPLPPRKGQLPFRLLITDIATKAHGGLSLAGRVDAGSLAVGDTVMVVPGQELVTIKHIERENRPASWAVPSDFINFSVTVSDPSVLTYGSVLCDPQHPIPQATEFVGQVIGLPALQFPLVEGSTILLHMQGIDVPVTLKQIISVYQAKSKSFSQKKKNRILIKSGGRYEVRFAVQDRSICLDLYEQSPRMGRFLLREKGFTVAAGLVSQIL